MCNLRPQIPETEGYDVAAHVAALARHDVAVDTVVCDTIQGMAIGEMDVPVIERSPDGQEPAWSTVPPNWRRLWPVCWHRRPKGPKERET